LIRIKRLTWCVLSGFLCITLLIGCGARVMYEGPLRNGVYHQVQHGQTLWGIAQAYGVELNTLARANNVFDMGTLHVGQKLYIPGATQQRSVASRCPCRSQEAKASNERTPAPRTGSPPLKTPSSSQEQNPVKDFPLIWPLQGMITRKFVQGSKDRHDGIDIVAPQDTPIQAAADGKVIYSDWGPGGYGRIVVLQHHGDVVTVYAHNQRNLVRVGDFVRQGEHIATVGKTGRATAYHLHFEIRHRTVPVSPILFLPNDRQIARAASQ
jgi:murein DD-endopeptidase MepM/ murein hydrolase activator NlpD